MVTFKNLSSSEGLKELNEYLLTRSYITGYQASKDDLAVFAHIQKSPSATSYPHVSRWYNHITALIGSSFPGTSEGVCIEGQMISGNKEGSVMDNGSFDKTEVKEEEEDEDLGKDVLEDDEDDDEDLELFGELSEEEKKAREEKNKAIEAKKAKAKANAAKAKSMIIIDVKPWDDTTDMQKLEEDVRSVQKDGLLWGQSKLVPVGFGIKKLQITAVIEDSKIQSFDEIIEDDLVKDGEADNIQSVDIVAFNKI